MTKVLVVEDESIVRRDLVLTTPWEEIGCICIGGAENAQEALDFIREQKPDIIITDIRMPQLSGLELIDIVAELCAVDDEYWCECIILSGYSDFEYARRAMRSGVQEYLVKPVDDDELLASIVRAKKRIDEHKSDDTLKKKLDGTSGSLFMLFKEYNLTNQKSANARYVSEAIKSITEHYVGGISIEDAAEALSISSSYLSRIFKTETGYTFVDYLTYYRIKRAAELLEDQAVRIYEVADLVGYSDARYFSQIFRKLTGMTPKEFRDSLPEK